MNRTNPVSKPDNLIQLNHTKNGQTSHPLRTKRVLAYISPQIYSVN